MQFRLREKGHINIQEGRARRALIKKVPRDLRIPIMQDSSV
jgi:hypothetical protein